MNLLTRLQQRFAGSITAANALGEQLQDMCSIAECVVKCLRDGGTVYTAGNGGSAAQALHLAEELIGRYRDDRPAQRAVCLNADSTAITCIANDYGFERIFSRQCEALLTERDVLVVLTTSGNSPNIINALQIAQQRAVATIGLLGSNGGTALALCDRSIVIPGSDSAHTQEAHQIAIHLICEAVDVAQRVDAQSR